MDACTLCCAVVSQYGEGLVDGLGARQPGASMRTVVPRVEVCRFLRSRSVPLQRLETAAPKRKNEWPASLFAFFAAPPMAQALRLPKRIEVDTSTSMSEES